MTNLFGRPQCLVEDNDCAADVACRFFGPGLH
jgi:hypothetical protein